MADGSEPIDPAEIIYRRIPPAWAGMPFPSPLAFTPRPEDVEGLSAYRAKYTKDIAEVAYNDRGTHYFIAVLHVRDLIAAGIEIVPSPDLAHGRPGHVHLPAIKYHNRKTPEATNLINLLTTKLSTIRGPFPSSPPARPQDTGQSSPLQILP